MFAVLTKMLLRKEPPPSDREVIFISDDDEKKDEEIVITGTRNAPFKGAKQPTRDRNVKGKGRGQSLLCGLNNTNMHAHSTLSQNLIEF